MINVHISCLFIAVWKLGLGSRPKIANHSSQWSNMADRKTSPKASSSRAGGNRRGPPPEPSSASFLEFIQQVQPRISLRRVTVSEEEIQRARMIVILDNLAAALEDDNEA